MKLSSLQKPDTDEPALSLTRLSIQKLYGYMDKTIDFNEDINFLVGINGSGKTSVLNIISWLFQPAMMELCVTSFEKLRIEFKRGGGLEYIECSQGDSELTVSICDGKGSKPHPLKVQLFRNPAGIDTDERAELLAKYRNMTPAKGEAETWGFLQELPKPIVVGLDRDLRKNSSDIEAFDMENPLYRKRASHRGYVNPLPQVKNLASNSYNAYRSKVIDLNEALRDKIFFSAFQSRSNQVTSELDTNQLEKLKDRVSRYLSQHILTNKKRSSETRSGQRTITKFFEGWKSQLEKHKTKSKDADFEQLAKVKQVVEFIEEFETSVEKVYAQVKTYLSTVNRFLKDSYKVLQFDDTTSKLFYVTLDQTGAPLNRKDLNSLSSGERQVVALMTYIAFTTGRTFIIDEPEISLHPKWQDEFMVNIIELMPKGTQLIIATHSPSIVGKHLKYCKPLYPYND